jgi:biopolymer transport protein ExbD/biopolymer transport protein TolR
MGAASGEEFTDINVTPLTDVFLVLLVIMILIAPLIDKSELNIKPPETRNAKKPDESKGVSIDLDKNGNIAIGGRKLPNTDPTTIQQAITEFRKKIGNKDISCTVNADGDCKQRDVVNVMTGAAAAGIKKMRVATIQANQY